MPFRDGPGPPEELARPSRPFGFRSNRASRPATYFATSGRPVAGFAAKMRAPGGRLGAPRQRGSSHRVYETPWQGDPRINIQNDKGKAKAYQVKQVLLAVEKMEVEHTRKKR